jgi:hypothetical protein
VVTVRTRPPLRTRAALALTSRKFCVLDVAMIFLAGIYSERLAHAPQWEFFAVLGVLGVSTLAVYAAVRFLGGLPFSNRRRSQ